MFFSNRHDTRIFNDTKLFFLSCKLSPVALYLYPFIYPSIHPPPKVNALTLACVKVQLWLFHPLKSTRNIFLYSISIHLYFLFLMNSQSIFGLLSCHFILFLLFCVVFWSSCAACGILFPHQGSNLHPYNGTMES